MPDYVSHIILLPQGADWEWYKAIRNYLLHFRVTVTQSADDAGSFHGTSHTITVIDVPDGWPGDIATWLRDNYCRPEDDPGFEERLAVWDHLLMTRWPFLVPRMLWSVYNGADRLRLTQPDLDPAELRTRLVRFIERAERPSGGGK